MRLHIVWTSPTPVKLPWNYPHLLHGFLYNAISKASPKLGRFLHEQGFVVGTRRYKLLTFSLLFPESVQPADNGLVMNPPIHWWVSSPLLAPMEALALTLLSEGKAEIGKVLLQVERVETEEEPKLSRRCLFRTMSPIVVSTGVRRGEKLEHKFLSPEDPRFWRILEENLRRKAEVLGLRVSEEPLQFKLEGEERSRLFVVQGTKVRGFEMWFWAEGDETLIRVGYEAGFGERNAQGFGMVRLVRAVNIPDHQ